jgi:hypothetical protein
LAGVKLLKTHLSPDAIDFNPVSRWVRLAKTAFCNGLTPLASPALPNSQRTTARKWNNSLSGFPASPAAV